MNTYLGWFYFDNKKDTGTFSLIAVASDMQEALEIFMKRLTKKFKDDKGSEILNNCVITLKGFCEITPEMKGVVLTDYNKMDKSVISMFCLCPAVSKAKGITVYCADEAEGEKEGTYMIKELKSTVWGVTHIEKLK